jgi:Tfp pilus assembly protein PilE
MSKKGLAWVEIIIMFAVVILLSAILIPHLADFSNNSETAKSVLRKLSTAAENYAVSHKGTYPSDVVELSGFMPLAGNYCANASGTSTIVGEYSYSCILTPGGYSFSAGIDSGEDEREGLCTVTTGGIFTPFPSSR